MSVIDSLHRLTRKTAEANNSSALRRALAKIWQLTDVCVCVCVYKTRLTTITTVNSIHQIDKI